MPTTTSKINTSRDAPSTTTIVNAAFLHEVKESNLQLWAVLQELRTLAADQQSWPSASDQLVSDLAQLRDCIATEFSLEETYGFIEGIPRVDLVGVNNASTARMQHRELYLQLSEICEQAEKAQYSGTIARDLPIYVGAFEAFDDALRAHEELETELIRCGLGMSSRPTIVSSEIT